MFFKEKCPQKHELLDQIMFINVFRKSPRKQFTGELTDLQSSLTEVPALTPPGSSPRTPAESHDQSTAHPVPLYGSTTKSFQLADGQRAASVCLSHEVMRRCNVWSRPVNTHAFELVFLFSLSSRLDRSQLKSLHLFGANPSSRPGK